MGNCPIGEVILGGIHPFDSCLQGSRPDFIYIYIYICVLFIHMYHIIYIDTYVLRYYICKTL